MKFVKHLLALAIALCALPSMLKAQAVNVVAVGGGSSALFLELGQGAVSGTGTGATNTPCVWTSKKNSNIVARDNRPFVATGSSVDEQGNFWVTWNQGNGVGATCADPLHGTSTINVNVYSYMQLDSTVGDKCFFEGDGPSATGCQQVLTVALPAAGANLLTGFTDTSLPSVIESAVNGKHFTYAGTDIRPEDAKFATYRMFQPCGQVTYRNPYDLGYRLTYGLGYSGAHTGIGLQVHSAFSSSVFNVLDFAINGGPDPITGNPTPPSFAVSTVGAQPIVVAVAPASDTAGIAGASDINGFTLSLFYEGILARSTDLMGPSTTNPVVTLVREPLSGTYNTFEYSMPNSSQFHTSQDDNFCNGSAVYNTTMNIGSGTGAEPGAVRARVIGTGEMVSTLQAATSDSLGYFFWSAANANGASNLKYLTVNGVDPLLDSYGSSGGLTYTQGALPQASPGAGVPPLTAVSFKNLNAGDYPIWSAIRIVSAPSDPAVAALLTSLGPINSTQHDYITLANLKVWHSHFPIYAIVGNWANGTTINPATPNDLCTGGSAEAGGDAGGTNVLKQVNADFCSDYGNPLGLTNKTN
jgi:hypothetical protein